MKKLDNDKRIEAIRLYNTTKFNQRLIGEKIGCSEATIRNILKEAGIEYNPANRIGIEEAVEEAPVVPCISLDDFKEIIEGLEVNIAITIDIIQTLKKTFINK